MKKHALLLTCYCSHQLKRCNNTTETFLIRIILLHLPDGVNFEHVYERKKTQKRHLQAAAKNYCYVCRYIIIYKYVITSIFM